MEHLTTGCERGRLCPPATIPFCFLRSGKSSVLALCWSPPKPCAARAVESGWFYAQAPVTFGAENAAWCGFLSPILEVELISPRTGQNTVSAAPFSAPFDTERTARNTFGRLLDPVDPSLAYSRRPRINSSDTFFTRGLFRRSAFLFRRHRTYALMVVQNHWVFEAFPAL